MQDALRSPQSVLVLGGTSEIAQAIVDRFVQARCSSVVLAGRAPADLEQVAARYQRAGVEQTATAPFDALDPSSHRAAIDQAFDAHGDIDMVVLAFGVLGDQAEFDADPAGAAEAVATNFAGAVSASLAVADRFRRQGHGTLLVLSSVAGVRARADNYVYGSTKAGLDAFAQGLGDALVGSGARVVVVRPGFVHSKMTEGMDPAPFATTPEKVADAVVDGLAKGREVIYAPAVLAGVAAAFRVLPRAVWRRVSAR